MVEPQRDDHPDIQDVLTWAGRARKLGIGDAGLEINRPFIPDPEIDAYFQDIVPIRKLLAALFPDGAPQVDPDTIRKKYAKVFLILLLTGNGRFIKLFVRHDSLCDRHLPFSSRPAHFPQSTPDPDFFFTSFYRQQWEFCARIFEYGTDLQFDEKDLILPIIDKERLGGGGSAIVHKIKLHPAYNKLGRDGPSREGSIDPNTHTFVLKTYNTPDAERYYNNEVNGFLRLGNGGGLHIIGFHGSFVRNGTYNVLLEYADRGNLQEYFDTIQPPSSGEDIMKFWRELFKTLGALVAIHSVQPSNPAASSDSYIFQGFHQDVKPKNILVKSKKGGSPYDCEFKLADLGLSHFKKHVPSHGEVTDRDTHGTRSHGAPECYRADGDIERLPFLVKQSVDIWSLGCTFSEAAIWVVHGNLGLSEYRRRCGLETADIPGFRDGDCFHDGWQVLGTVKDTHRTLADDIRPRDHVTGATVAMVTEEMLIDADFRSSAKSLNHRTKGILQRAETSLRRPVGISSSSAPVAQSPPRTPPEPPPGHIRSRSSNSHSQRLPSLKYASSLASTSYYEDEAHNQEPVDDFFDKKASQQAYHSDRPRRQITGLANTPSYIEYEDQDHISQNPSNRASREIGVSQASSSGPSWRQPLRTPRTQRRTPSDLSPGVNTRNGPDVFARDRQETYNVRQGDKFTVPLRGVSRTSTTTLVQDPTNGSRVQNHANVASGTRASRSVSFGPSNVPPPMESQPRREPIYLSVADAQQWKRDKKEHKSVKLPDDHLLADLKNVDHVFLIDDSSSMRPFRREVHDLFGLLAYIVKGTDPDGIDLQFTMSREKKAREKHTDPLLRILETVQYIGESNIRTQLGEILQDYHAKLRDLKKKRSSFKRTRPPRPVRRQNIYILTDGVWQPDCDPTQLIKKMVDNLDEYSMEREQFGIQFIRFGNDSNGINRLNQLDSGLHLSMDIVDTEPSNGNVWKMLRGATNDWFDDNNVPANGSAMASPIVDTFPGTNTLHHFGKRSTHT